jgi:ribosome-binding protein aMBF1 (putative translation factor)
MTNSRSSIGTRVEDEIARKRSRSARYRDAHDRLRPFEQIARVVIMRRAQLGLSQQELADRVGTTASVISRIESGQHRTSIETLRRLAEALGGHALLGFDFGTASEPAQELIRL